MIINKHLQSAIVI